MPMSYVLDFFILTLFNSTYIYCVAWNFHGSLISRIADFLCFRGNKFLRIWISDFIAGSKIFTDLRQFADNLIEIQ